MANKSSVIKVTMVGDADSLARAFGTAGKAADQMGDDTEKAGGRFSGAIKGMAVAAGGFLAAQGLQKAVSFIGSGIEKASDLAETVSKNKTVFGEAFGELQSWSKSAPQALGMTQQAALDATGSLGNMFTQLGIGSAAAKDLSKSNVQLAADFASFQNANPTDVLEAIQAAYRGEYDALQKYVPTINAAAVEQEALAETGKATTDELTAQDKALATNALMQKNAGAAAGDFARTQDSSANRSKTLHAEWEQMQTTLGTKLLPTFNMLQGILLEKVIPAIGGFVNFMKEHKELMIGAAVALGVLTVAVIALGIASVAGFLPWIAGTVALAALVAGVVYAYNHFAWFKTTVDALGAAFSWVFNWVQDNWPLLLAILTGPFGVAAYIINRNWDTIKDTVSGVKDWIVNTWDSVVGFLSNLPYRIWYAVSGMFDGIKEAFRSAINWIIQRWNGLQFSVPGVDLGPFGHFGGFTIGVPDIPYLAHGGIVTKPTLAVVGEAGPEAVVPLGRGGGATGMGSTNYHVTINVPPGANARAIGRTFRKYLNESDRAGI